VSAAWARCLTSDELAEHLAELAEVVEKGAERLAWTGDRPKVFEPEALAVLGEAVRRLRSQR
jgi:hypothetical protein